MLIPARSRVPEAGIVMDKLTAGTGRMWPLWALWLPGALAVVVAGLLAVVDLGGMVMGSWDVPAPGLHWLRAGAIGQCVLGAAAAAVLVTGAAHASWRAAAAITAWAILAAEIGWFLLTRALAGLSAGLHLTEAPPAPWAGVR